jgi:hypothetical protein
MEILLLLWDELDDWTGACRHLAECAVSEVAVLSAPLATATSAAAVWLLLPQFRMNAALLACAATFWGAYRHLLRFAAT